MPEYPGFSNDYEKYLFLMEFVKRIIINSYKEEIIPEEKEVVNLESIRQNAENIPPVSEEIPKIPVITEIPRRILPPVLRIPEIRLPEKFQYLRPTPTYTNIDLDKLNPLIRDNNVRVIECNGSNEAIIVEGGMGRKFTGIILTQEEVNYVIKKFSETAKIPAAPGVFRVVVGRLVFMAIISDIIGSKFVIRKMG